LLIIVLLNGGARPDAKRIAVSPGVRVQLSSLRERACVCDERAQVLIDWGKKAKRFRIDLPSMSATGDRESAYEGMCARNRDPARRCVCQFFR